jgi:hypothetical protein
MPIGELRFILVKAPKTWSRVSVTYGEHLLRNKATRYAQIVSEQDKVTEAYIALERTTNQSPKHDCVENEAPIRTLGAESRDSAVPASEPTYHQDRSSRGP